MSKSWDDITRGLRNEDNEDVPVEARPKTRRKPLPAELRPKAARKAPLVGGRRRDTDVLSEQMATASGWQRGVLRTTRGVSAVARGYFLLLGAVGLIGLVGAVATLHWAAAGGALLTVFIAGCFLATAGGAPETVREVRAPAGQYVIRIGPRKVWRIERGMERLRAFANGGVLWRVAVRKREDDPLGAVAHEVLAATEREALGVADAVERQLRSGDLLAESPSDAMNE